MNDKKWSFYGLATAMVMAAVVLFVIAMNLLAR